jgi:hypothetical protein
LSDTLRHILGIDFNLNNNFSNGEKMMENKILKFGDVPVEVIQFYDPKTVHINAYLTMVSKMYKNNAFVWNRLFPRQPVTKQADKIPVYGVEHLMRVADLRADKAPSKEVLSALGTALTYDTNAHALKGLVSERERRNQDPPINADMDMTELVTGLIELQREFQAYDLIVATGSYDSSSHYTTLSDTDQWDDYVGSSPLDVIDAGKDQIFNTCGKVANTIMLPYKVASKLSRHPDVLELTKYTHSDLLTAGRLPLILRGLEVVEADAMYNTKIQGQTAVISGIWSDYVFIGYVNPSMGIKDTTWGTTLDWGGRITRSWHDNDKNADVIEVEEQGLDMKVFDGKCGYLIIDTLSS